MSTAASTPQPLDFVFQPISAAAANEPPPAAVAPLSPAAAAEPLVLAPGLQAAGSAAHTPFLLKRVRPVSSPQLDSSEETPTFGSPTQAQAGLPVAALFSPAALLDEAPAAASGAASKAGLAAPGLEDQKGGVPQGEGAGQSHTGPIVVAAAASNVHGHAAVAAAIHREAALGDLIAPISARTRAIAPLTLPQSPKLCTSARGSRRAEPSAAFLAAMSAQVAAQRRHSAALAAAAAERRHSAAHHKAVHAGASHKPPATAAAASAPVVEEPAATHNSSGSSSKAAAAGPAPASTRMALVEAAAARLGRTATGTGTAVSPQAATRRSSRVSLTGV